jgi:hypothetical protein
LTDVLGGQVDLFVTATSIVTPFIHAGKLKPPSGHVAESTGSKAELKGGSMTWAAGTENAGHEAAVQKRIERVIVERVPQSAPGNIDEPSTEVVREMPGRHWSAD